MRSNAYWLTELPMPDAPYPMPAKRVFHHKYGRSVALIKLQCVSNLLTEISDYALLHVIAPVMT